jgi:hypothetical protein
MEETAGSIRNSHRDTNPIKRKFAPKKLAEAARALVDGCSATGPIIRQRLDVERMKQPLQKGLFYVIENDGMAEPGFLVFLNGAAPVFLQTKTKAAPPCTLRMRVSPTLGEGGGSILIATLDAIQHTLRIEDVWMWKGQAIYDTQGYSKRRDYLKEFVERCWVPDARLMGGIQTTILNPRSVQAFLETPATSVSTIELIPEMAGKRRMWQGGGTPPLPPSQTISKVPGSSQTTVPYHVPQKSHNDLAESTPPQSTPQKKQVNLAESTPPSIFTLAGGAGGAACPPLDKNFTRAIAKVVDKMPDIYDLCDEDGRIIGQGSVQQFSLSQTLRSKQTAEGVLVAVRWRDEFGGYEISGLF